MGARTAVAVITGVTGGTMAILGIIVEIIPMLIAGFVLVLICSGCTWADNQTKLKEIEKIEEEIGGGRRPAEPASA